MRTPARSPRTRRWRKKRSPGSGPQFDGGCRRLNAMVSAVASMPAKASSSPSLSPNADTTGAGSGMASAPSRLTMRHIAGSAVDARDRASSRAARRASRVLMTPMLAAPARTRWPDIWCMRGNSAGRGPRRCHLHGDPPRWSGRMCRQCQPQARRPCSGVGQYDQFVTLVHGVADVAAQPFRKSPPDAFKQLICRRNPGGRPGHQPAQYGGRALHCAAFMNCRVVSVGLLRHIRSALVGTQPTK